MNISPRILMLEHDLRLARFVRDSLSLSFSGATVVFDSEAVIRELLARRCDLILADCETLPGKDGVRFCRKLRESSAAPLLLFSGQFTAAERTRLLNAGADDCLSRPLDLPELSARINAVWRRYLAQPPQISFAEPMEKCLDYPHLFISLSNYTVICGDMPVEMAPRELELLYFLAKSPNQVFSREQLLDNIWGYDYLGDARTVDVHIKRIRKKLNGALKKDHAAWSLDTVWGVGYRFRYSATRTSSDVRTSAAVKTGSA